MLSFPGLKFGNAYTKYAAIGTCLFLTLVILLHLANTVNPENAKVWAHKFLPSVDSGGSTGSYIPNPVDPKLANSTLGFGAILAVSAENASDPGAWRRKGIVGAANRTGLDIQIPEQRQLTVKEFMEFRKGEGQRPGEGSALAWMAHLDMIQSVADNDLGTALILEDDVDWDVFIREQLAPAGSIAGAIRNLTDASLPYLEHPFGTGWDVLWLGHCGASKNDKSTHITVDDPTLLSVTQMRALWGKDYIRLGDYRREIVKGIHATCTYAYAVRAASVKKIIPRLSKGGAAFDNELAGACIDGDLTCLTVSPELFHHQVHVGSEGIIGELEKDLKGKGKSNKKASDRVFTLNIKYSARCNVGTTGEDLKQCLPTNEEFNRYPSR